MTTFTQFSDSSDEKCNIFSSDEKCNIFSSDEKNVIYFLIITRNTNFGKSLEPPSSCS